MRPDANSVFDGCRLQYSPWLFRDNRLREKLYSSFDKLRSERLADRFVEPRYFQENNLAQVGPLPDLLK